MRSLLIIMALAAPVAAEPAAAVVEARAAAELPPHLGLLSVSVPPSVMALDVAPGQVALHWRRGLRAGNATVQVTIAGRKTWARLEIGERAPVVVAARPLVPGARVGAGDLELAVRTVPRDTGWRLDPRSLVGAEILAAAGPGAAIDGSIIAEPAPIARGARIAVAIRRGRMTASTTGILERAARPGELAQLRLSSSRTIVRARLVSATRAVLETP